MCGICFKTNFYNETSKAEFINACRLLKHRGPDEEGFIFKKDYSFGHERLTVLDKDYGKQPMSNEDSVLVYNGEIYNIDLLKKHLEKYDVTYNGYSDTEVLFHYLNHFKEKGIKSLNGIFAFVYATKDYVIAARDHAGVKPLYYTFVDNDIMISSEIKSLLYYKHEAVINIEGLQELLGLGPMHSLGKTVYKGIYELKPGNYLTFSKDKGLQIYEYFKLVARKCNKSYEQVVSDVRRLVDKAITCQLNADIKPACFLSGGLDSSIITLRSYDKLNSIDTYSIDYEENDKYYTKNAFETSSDNDYIPYVINDKDISNYTVKITSKDVTDFLKKTLEFKDYPGMADIDSSMYFLALNIANKHNVGISGECADEIFGGYPWFYKTNKLDHFPWITNIEMRSDLLNDNIREKLHLKEYLENVFKEALESVPTLDTDSTEEIKNRQMMFLNVKYFMTTLLERKDRMTMGASLEVRVPFADKDLITYLYNVPFEYKYKDGVEKKLLRDAYKDILPIEIYKRKKSPYPKSRSRKYEQMIKDMLLECISQNDSILNKLFDKEKLIEMIKQDSDLEVPWFGQLMRKTQLCAYLWQIDYWFKTYNIKLEI